MEKNKTNAAVPQLRIVAPHQDDEAFEQSVKHGGQDQEFPRVSVFGQRVSSQVEQQDGQACSPQGPAAQAAGRHHVAQQPPASVPERSTGR